jgi:excisionase family DNA binding protein
MTTKKKCHQSQQSSLRIQRSHVSKRLENFDIRIWLIEDVAKFLGVSIGHIYNLTSRREIPFRRKGKKGRLYFIPAEIMQWIDEGEVL